MPYEYDVFISYRRQRLWTPWVRDNLKELIETYLQQDLGQIPRIFVDERIEVGADWIDSLGEALAKSKIVLGVFSKDYFASPWCIHELDLITRRSSDAAGGSRDKCRLIVPTVVHDGEIIPDPVRRIQPCNLKKFRVAHICKGTPLYQDFSAAIGALSPQIARAIELAPDFEEGWIEHHQSRFSEVYESDLAGNAYPPEMFDLVEERPLAVPPRLTGV